MRFCLATLFCIVTWMSSIQTSNGQKCPCLGVSTTRPRISLIKSYTIQPEGLCSVKAIVFLTASGKKICSDPNLDWVKKAMKKVDQEKKEQGPTTVIYKVDTETTAAPVTEEKEQGPTTVVQKVDTETSAAPVLEEKEQVSTTVVQKVDTETTAAPVTEEKEQGPTTVVQKVDTETTAAPVMKEKEQVSTTVMQKVDTDLVVPPVIEEKKESSIVITPAASRASKRTKPKRRRIGKRRQRKTTLRKMRGLKRHA